MTWWLSTSVVDPGAQHIGVVDAVGTGAQCVQC
jgi:hypothetical protein